jgi:transcriptional regulator with XRE-family HTH domain
MTEALRQAIVASNVPLLRLERETGVSRMSVSRFVRGVRSLRLDVADKLADYFDLELRKRG